MMNQHNGRQHELASLLEALCEDRLAGEEFRRLESLLTADAAARRLYLEYIDLHGNLHWDTARGFDDDLSSLTAADADRMSDGRPSQRAAPLRAGSAADGDWKLRAAPPLRRRVLFAGAALAATLVLSLIIVAPWQSREPRSHVVDSDDPSGGHGDNGAATGRPRVSVAHADQTNAATRRVPGGARRPVVLPPGRTESVAANATATISSTNRPVAAPRPDRIPARVPPNGIVALIDAELEAGWRAAGVEPSPAADDAEWLRRVYLDLVGHIPPADEAARFLADDGPRRRQARVLRLLDDPDYVRHWTAVTANLLVGRSMDREINRPALEKYLRDSFAENRPWNEIVAEFVDAEGSGDENGAANFLLAHVNNQAVPATAVMARVFLGTQIGCVQCHDHPVNSDWKQEQFWQLNGFFKQTQLVRRVNVDRSTGRAQVGTELVSRPIGGPTYFETLRGVVQATYPQFEDHSVPPDAEVDRREVLARLMFSGERPQAARAIVNRVWAHFFGYGFTRPIDDMGPHNPPTHPELLDRLTDAFVASGYDLQALMQWITATRAYQLSSRFDAGNRDDDPEAGYPALFSRVYVKPMTAEQLYDSLVVATRVDLAAGSSWEAAARRRLEWLQPFVHDYQTEENDEDVEFEGTISQALLMMNGELVATAVGSKSGTVLSRVLSDRTSDVEKIRHLCLATLSRYPTAGELEAIRRLVRNSSAETVRSGGDRQAATASVLQDVYWAYLNSSEFRLVH